MFIGSVDNIKAEYATRFLVLDLVCIPESSGEMRLPSG